jgi:hypothetical protein
MKHTIEKLVLVSALLLVGLGAAAAQEPTQAEIDAYIDLVRMDIRQGRSELVGQNMQLSAGQAAKFWPIYEQYEAAYATLGDARLQLIRDYAAAYDTMTDQTAATLADRMFAQLGEEQALLKEYFEKVEVSLGASMAVRFAQIERRVGALLEMQLYADIPLLEPAR